MEGDVEAIHSENRPACLSFALFIAITVGLRAGLVLRMLELAYFCADACLSAGAERVAATRKSRSERCERVSAAEFEGKND